MLAASFLMRAALGSDIMDFNLSPGYSNWASNLQPRQFDLLLLLIFPLFISVG